MWGCRLTRRCACLDAGNKWSTNKFLPYGDMITTIEARFGKLERIVDAPSDTSKVRSLVLDCVPCVVLFRR